MRGGSGGDFHNQHQILIIQNFSKTERILIFWQRFFMKKNLNEKMKFLLKTTQPNTHTPASAIL
jgi:hypothetical protein